MACPFSTRLTSENRKESNTPALSDCRLQLSSPPQRRSRHALACQPRASSSLRLPLHKSLQNPVPLSLGHLQWRKFQKPPIRPLRTPTSPRLASPCLRILGFPPAPAMEAVVVDAGSKLLKAGIALPDQAPALVSARISPAHAEFRAFFLGANSS
jgi:hypothetical protein